MVKTERKSRLQNFEYTVPETLGETVNLLASNKGQTRILAGGTDLIVQLRQGALSADYVLDIKYLPECNVLRYAPSDGLTIGAAVPCHRIYSDSAILDDYPGLIDAAAIIGGIQIQGRATFGGNVCNSSPSADSIPMLIAYGAECEIAGPQGNRRVPVEDFCTAPGKNVLEKGELLVALHLPPVQKSSGANYLRFIPRYEMDIAVVGAGACVQLDEDGKSIEWARIGLAAVAPTPLFAREAGELLTGKEVSEESIEAAALAAQSIARPISDMRAPADYRKHLVKVLTRRALWGAIGRARGEFVPNAVQENGR